MGYMDIIVFTVGLTLKFLNQIYLGRFLTCWLFQIF